MDRTAVSVSAEVVEVNKTLKRDPEKINSDGMAD
jgi:glycine cleavage system H lipoate-binding protein